MVQRAREEGTVKKPRVWIFPFEIKVNKNDWAELDRFSRPTWSDGTVYPGLSDRVHHTSRAILWIRIRAMHISEEFACHFPLSTFFWCGSYSSVALLRKRCRESKMKRKGPPISPFAPPTPPPGLVAHSSETSLSS